MTKEDCDEEAERWQILEDENAALQASNKRLWNWLNNILTGMKEQSGDPYDECPYCMSELFCYDEQLEIQAKMEELEQKK